MLVPTGATGTPPSTFFLEGDGSTLVVSTQAHLYTLPTRWAKVGPQWCLLVSKAQVASTKAEDVFTVQCHHECRQQSSQQTWCIVEFLGWNKKQQNHGDYRISNGFGFFGFFVLLCLFFVFFWCSPRGPPQRVSKDFLVGSMIFVNSLPGILPKEYQNIVVFLFVWRCTYEYVQIAAKCEHKKWACY